MQRKYLLGGGPSTGPGECPAREDRGSIRTSERESEHELRLRGWHWPEYASHTQKVTTSGEEILKFRKCGCVHSL